MALGKSLREFKEAVNTADVKADEKNNDEVETESKDKAAKES
ncbi:twin-arginine translocase TatA/TatE family subunit [Megasphaera sp.]